MLGEDKPRSVTRTETSTMAKLTVHMKDSPLESWLEVDGKRVEGIESVIVSAHDRVIDERVYLSIVARVPVKNEKEGL